MKIKLRKYKDSDFDMVKRGVEGLADHIISVDPLKRSRRLPKYSKLYVKKLMFKIKKNKGILLIAYENKNIVGFVAGFIEKQSKESLMECVPTKAGKIEDLFIYPKYRSKNIGRRLMKKIEDYFKSKGCDALRLHVFAPNIRAHDFYKRLNYQDRMIEMIKLIKK